MIKGHIFALSSVFFWSALYVCVKILLGYFSPFEAADFAIWTRLLLLATLSPKILAFATSR